MVLSFKLNGNSNCMNHTYLFVQLRLEIKMAAFNVDNFAKSHAPSRSLVSVGKEVC